MNYLLYLKSSSSRWVPLFALLFVVSVWPLVMLIFGTLRSAPPGFDALWTLAHWRETFIEARTLTAITDSLWVAFTSTLGATLMAAGLAFLSERSDLPFKRGITFAMLIAFATPALFYAMAYGFLANPYSGQLNVLFAKLLGEGHFLLNIETYFGVILVMMLKKTAIIYLFLIAPFRNLDPSHDEASLLCGATPIQTFFKINLPSLAPALTVAVLIGIVGGLQAYDMVLILGGPIGLDMISTRIIGYINSGAPADFGRASVLSLSIVVILILLCLLQKSILGKRSYVSVGGKRGAPRLTRLKSFRWPLFVISSIALLFIAVLPVGSVILASVQPFPGVYDSLTLDHYRHVLALPRVWDAIGVTFILSLVVGVVAMLLALFIAQSGNKVRGWKNTLVRFLTLVPLAMPGIVIALAILWGFVSVPLLRELFGSIWLLIAAMTICSLPIAIQISNAAISQLSPDLTEAARISGASPGRAFFDVLLRLLAPAFFAGWFMVAVMVSGNLEVPMLLKSPGLSPVAMVVYNINAAGDFSGAAALLVIVLAAKLIICVIGVLIHYALKWNAKHRAAKQAAEFHLLQGHAS